MSIKVSSLCWKLRLQQTEKLVLIRLADFSDDIGGNIFPAVATIADHCCISDRAVQYTLKKLVDMGVLILVGNETGGRGRTREYAIDVRQVHQMIEQQKSKAKAKPDSGGNKNEKGENGAKGEAIVSPFNGNGAYKAEKPAEILDFDAGKVQTTKRVKMVQRVNVAVKNPEPRSPDSSVTDLFPEAIASGHGSAKPSTSEISIKSRIFGECLDWFAQATDKPKVSCRPILGKWISIYGENNVVSALLSAAFEHQNGSPKIDPVSAITSRLSGREKGNSHVRQFRTGKSSPGPAEQSEIIDTGNSWAEESDSSDRYQYMDAGTTYTH